MYFQKSTDVIGYVGDAELLCVEHGNDSMPAVFNDGQNEDEACANCHRRLLDVV